MSNAVVKDDIVRGSHGIHFREIIEPAAWERREREHEVCTLKIDFSSEETKERGQMLLSLDSFDLEQLLPVLVEQYKKWRDARESAKKAVGG